MQVRTFLRPAALCVVLFFGAGPVAAIACDLACSPPPAHNEHHHTETHHHSPAVEDTASSPYEFALTGTRDSNCKHDVLGSPALTSSALKVVAPSAAHLIETAIFDIRYTQYSWLASSTASPPGVRSGPLPLRI